MHLLYDFGYAKLRRSVIYNEDEAKQFVKLDRVLRGTIDTEESSPFTLVGGEDADWITQFAVQPLDEAIDTTTE